MKIFSSLAPAAVLCAAAWTGYLAAPIIPGAVFPFAAVLIFILGTGWRIARWLASPVPFNITVTAGQQKSLPWISHRKTENPDNAFYAVLRMMMEVLMFRSLFRNTMAGRKPDGTPAYGSSKGLWVGAMAFHWSLLAVALRHLRFFIEPVPAVIAALEAADNLFHIGTPGLYLSDIVLAGALGYLIARRIALRSLRDLSLFQDYALPVLVAAVALTGVLLRYFERIDILAVKEYALSLLALSPALPAGAGVIFYMHITLVSALAAVIPFSKISHAAGVFLSPTRNMPGSSRRRRHENPWNAPVTVHRYGEWEDEFRDRLIKAGYPLEKSDGGKI